MKKTIEIVSTEKLAGDVFFKIQWNDEGETRQETIVLETLVELVRKRIGIVYGEENEELELAIAEAGIEYVEVDVPLSDDEEGFEVYLHEATIEDGEVLLDFEGTLLKRYKTHKGATKYVNQIASIVVE